MQPFTEQQLTSYKFMEVFTDDEVCTKNMKSLLRHKSRNTTVNKRKNYEQFKATLKVPSVRSSLDE